MKRTLLLFTCLMLLSWPQRAMAELQTAVFAGGCFWCMEHDLEHLPGVRDAVSGYSGGQLERLGEGGGAEQPHHRRGAARGAQRGVHRRRRRRGP